MSSKKLKPKKKPIVKGLREKKSNKIRIRVEPKELEMINNYRLLHNQAIDKGIDPKTVKHAWFKDEKSSMFVKNPNFDEGGLTLEKIKESLNTVFNNIDFDKPKIKLPKKSNNKAIKVTIADSHVGMNPSKNSLFQYEYNGKVYKDSLGKVFDSMLKEYNTHGVFDVSFLDDLGDMADGWNGYTTRGGHQLEQNMSNVEVFETCVQEKFNLVKSIIESKIAKKVVLRSVCNDNHSGDFGHVINLTIQMLLNKVYSDSVVEIDLLTRFIEHRSYGKHTFLLTHGKDAKFMNRGLPVILNDKAINFINDYIDHYGINNDFIHVEKGDLHQIGYQRTKKFDYRNFMSFAPPSAWIQHNFADSYSGYSIQVIPKESNEISHTDYFINYKKIKNEKNN